MSSIVGRIGEYYPRYDQEPPKLSEDLILPVVLQYVTLFILLEYRYIINVALTNVLIYIFLVLCEGWPVAIILWLGPGPYSVFPLY